MIEAGSFAARVRERFPEGLTAMVAVGGTRTTFILEQNRKRDNPGKIDDYAAYKDYLLDRYLEFISLYMSLGGWNMIITLFGYQSFYERGDTYAQFISSSTLDLINGKSRTFYEANAIDPYFVGIDTLLQLPKDHVAHFLGQELAAFQKQWAYRPEHRKVIWEIASIPLFSMWNAHQVMGSEAAAQLEADLNSATDLKSMHDRLYQYYSRAAYGTDIPTPHFYLGSNRNGDLKMRSVIPMSLLCGAPSRLYYTPYPTLFITRETLQGIISDFAFEAPKLRSTKMDYSEKYTAEQAEEEYQQFLELRNNPNSTVGLTRKINDSQE